MAIVKPFQAVRYNKEKIDLSRVVSPPYDVISPEKQEELHSRSDHNFTRLDFRKDVPGEDKYARAAELLEDWLRETVMVREQRPSVYFYRQQYVIRGETRRRYGFLALLKLEDCGANVHGHENTHSAAKADRTRLIRAVKANLSPIFVLFEDRKKLMEQNLKPFAEGREAFFEVTDDDRVTHTVWRLDDPQLMERVAEKMKGEAVFIADGHHRYEVSCAYRRERLSAQPGATGEEGFNYILAYFTNIASQGLTVLPIHRVLSLSSAPDWSAVSEKLQEYFSVEEVKHREDFLFLLQKAGIREHAVGMYGAGHCCLLRLKNIRFPERLMADRSAEYRSLDVAILNTLVLKNVFGFDPEAEKGSISYTADAAEAVSAADGDRNKVSFLMNPTKIEQIVRIALNGEKMPPKSTYFYPKVLSGLVVNKFD